MNKITKMSLIIILIIFLLILLHYTKVLKPIENAFFIVAKPVQKKVYNLSQYINDFYYNQKSKKELIEENIKLQEEVIKKQISESRLKEIEEQNEFLKRQLEFVQEQKINAIIANVIGKSQDSFQNFLIIDKGEKNGLEKGLAVTNQDVIIGKIYSASQYTSKVLLINDSFSQVAVSVQNKDHSIGILNGEYGLGLKINLIPQTEEIKEGDYVITSGLEENIPRGLLVGQIDNVLYTEGELFKTAFVKSPIDFNKIKWISVLKVEYDN